MLERASGSLANYPGHPPAAYGRLGYLVPDPILGAVKHVDFGELQQSGRKDTTRFFGTRSKVPMDWAALAIKPGRRSLQAPPHATGPATVGSAKSLLSRRFFYIVKCARTVYQLFPYFPVHILGAPLYVCTWYVPLYL